MYLYESRAVFELSLSRVAPGHRGSLWVTIWLPTTSTPTITRASTPRMPNIYIDEASMLTPSLPKKSLVEKAFMKAFVLPARVGPLMAATKPGGGHTALVEGVGDGGAGGAGGEGEALGASPPTMPPTIPPTAATAPAPMSALPQTGMSVVEDTPSNGKGQGVVVGVVAQQHTWELHCR